MIFQLNRIFEPFYLNHTQANFSRYISCNTFITEDCIFLDNINLVDRKYAFVEVEKNIYVQVRNQFHNFKTKIMKSIMKKIKNCIKSLSNMKAQLTDLLRCKYQKPFKMIFELNLFQKKFCFYFDINSHKICFLKQNT